jgi:hypothetical protein
MEGGLTVYALCMELFPFTGQTWRGGNFPIRKNIALIVSVIVVLL